jgi:alpha/beta superfamily hydrolase
MEITISVDDVTLVGALARPAGLVRTPGLILCHGLPNGRRGAATYASTYPELGERLARDAGWSVLTFNFRGSGASDGDFSIGGWQSDLQAAIAMMSERDDTTGIWLAGSSLGGAIALCEAARNPEVRGVATLAAPASLESWVAEPGRFLEHVKDVGLINTDGFPADPVLWEREIANLDPIGAASAIAPRPLFVLHGSNDDVVPLADARRLAAAGASTAELRIVYAAGHRLRHDPRAVAALIGWLDRQMP